MDQLALALRGSMDPPDLQEFVSRLLSQDRGLQVRIASNVARIYSDVLKEPVPTEVARLLAGLGAVGLRR